MRRSSLLILPLLLAAGCQGEPVAETSAEQSLGPPPAQLCQRNKEGLRQLQKSGAFDYDDQGGATIEQQIWFGLDEGKRDQLGQAVAFNAACAAGKLAPEQTATVRSETGIVLMQRIFPMTADMGSLLGE